MNLSLLTTLLDNVWAVALVVFFFGGSIFVHELGHFLAARWRGVYVARFSIGFGPKIVGWKRQGVEWRLSWIPLGGYVAIPQLADMRAIEGQFDVDVSKLPPISYATRMIVFGAGATFNVIFAFLLASILWFTGVPTNKELETTRIGEVLPTLTITDSSGTERKVPSPASLAGLRPGDVVTAIDGRTVKTWMDLQQTLYTSTGRTADDQRRAHFRILRDGQPLEFELFPQLSTDEKVRMVGIAPAEEFIVAKADALAATAGFQAGDRIAVLAGREYFSGSTLLQLLRDDPARPVPLTVERAGARVDLVVPDRSALKDPLDFGLTFEAGFDLVYRAPWVLIGNTVRDSARSLWAIVHPGSDLKVSNLSSPIGIARGFYLTAKADFRLVLWFTVLVNVSLAFFNLLPIPVLDGGHMMFATIGRLRGRALPTDFLMATQSAFMLLLFGMILYVAFFDVRRVRRDRAAAAERTAPAEAATPASTSAPAPATP